MMLKTTLTLFFLCLMTTMSLTQNKTFHDFQVKDIQGKAVDLSSFKGKKVLVVNVASKCGLTPQYADLQKLYDKYKDINFTIIGFPCNDFLSQEPGTNEEISEFCELNYGVTFQIMDKVVVKGESPSPIYKWLTRKSENGVVDAPIQWNFQKFMIDESGRLVDFVAPKENPFSDKIVNWIEEK